MKTNYRKGFEIFYFDGTGLPPVKVTNFDEFLKLMGEIDAEDSHGVVAPEGADGPIGEQLELPLQGVVSDREPSELTGSGTGTETSEGVRE